MKRTGHPAQLASQLLDMEPDLFLMDILLSGSSGIEVARSLREERFAEAPMVALSASVLRAQMAKHSGLFNETIRKPFDLDELFDVIERCLTAAGTPAPRLQPDVEGDVVKPWTRGSPLVNCGRLSACSGGNDSPSASQRGSQQPDCGGRPPEPVAEDLPDHDPEREGAQSQAERSLNAITDRCTDRERSRP